MVGATHRECTGCGTLFEITSKMTLCKTCNCNRVKSLSPQWKMHMRAKTRARERGFDFNIDLDDIVIPDMCPVLDIPINVNKGRSGAYVNSPSLDRIDNNKGYIKGNVQVVSQLANAMKGAATPEQLLKFSDWIIRTYKDNT